MSQSDGLRGFYKEFVDGEAGKDLLQWLVQQELSMQTQAYAAKTIEEKALFVERSRGYYDVRTRLDDMSMPPKSQSKSSSGGQRSSTAK